MAFSSTSCPVSVALNHNRSGGALPTTAASIFGSCCSACPTYNDSTWMSGFWWLNLSTRVCSVSRFGGGFTPCHRVTVVVLLVGLWQAVRRRVRRRKINEPQRRRERRGR